MDEQIIFDGKRSVQKVEMDGRGNEVPATRRNIFVEPEISTPVDVLEATTFFQAATSGATN